MNITLTLDTPNGNARQFTLPGAFEVCWRCSGKGSHVNPAIDGHGISTEEFDQDPDFRESYFAGHYDQTCDECKGLRVTEEVDEAALVRASAWKHAQFALYQRQQDEEASYRRECEMERRMGA